MPIDYETVRRNNPASPPGSDWDAREAAAVEKVRTEMAAEREREAHEAECREFAVFARHKADNARENKDDHRDKVWSQAAREIEAGRWPLSRDITSDSQAATYIDPRDKSRQPMQVVRNGKRIIASVASFQALRTRLNYQGKNAQVNG